MATNNGNSNGNSAKFEKFLAARSAAIRQFTQDLPTYPERTLRLLLETAPPEDARELIEAELTRRASASSASQEVK